MSSYPVVIDDVAAAAENLSDLGRETVLPVAMRIRAEVLRVAAARGWQLMPYDALTHAIYACSPPEHPWVVLDPLWRLDGAHSLKTIPLRASRILESGASSVVFGGLEFLDHVPHGPVGIIDDVVATGSTLLCVRNMLKSRGSDVARIVVGVVGPRAAVPISTALTDVILVSAIPGHHRAIHLRDACPFLPFSGRQLKLGANQLQDHAFRVPAIGLPGGLWQSVFTDALARHAAIAGRVAIVRALSSAIGRRARLSDLERLGSRLCFPLYPSEQGIDSDFIDELSGCT